MAQVDSSKITFENLKMFLQRLGFYNSMQTESSLAFQHSSTGTLIILSVPNDGKSVRPADLLSVLMRLENSGLVDQADLELIQSGQLPLAS